MADRGESAPTVLVGQPPGGEVPVAVRPVSMPEITPAQIIAIATAAISQIVAWGWIDDTTGELTLSLVGGIVPVILIIVDAIIRGNRSKMHAQIATAAIAAPGSTETNIAEAYQKPVLKKKK